MKQWYESNTVRALIVSATAHTLTLFGVTDLEAGEQANQLWTAIAAVAGLLIPIIGLIADYFGYRGRKVAEGPLA